MNVYLRKKNRSDSNKENSGVTPDSYSEISLSQDNLCHAIVSCLSKNNSRNK